MNIKVLSEQEVLWEAAEVLLKNLGRAKTARFWAARQKGEEDYLQIRDRLFEGQTVKTLYEQIQEFQKHKGE